STPRRGSRRSRWPSPRGGRPGSRSARSRNLPRRSKNWECCEMNVLVWVEHDNSTLKDATLATVTAAAKLGDVTLLVAGSGCRAVAEEAAQVAGVAKVLLADDPAYQHALAENVAPLVAGLMDGFDAFLAPATTTG